MRRSTVKIKDKACSSVLVGRPNRKRRELMLAPRRSPLGVPITLLTRRLETQERLNGNELSSTWKRVIRFHPSNGPDPKISRVPPPEEGR
jgi:hypothetical protein